MSPDPRPQPDIPDGGKLPEPADPKQPARREPPVRMERDKGIVKNNVNKEHMEYSSPIAELVQTPQQPAMPPPQPSAPVVPMQPQQPQQPQQTNPAAAILSQLTPEHMQAIAVAVSTAVAFSDPVQSKLTQAIKTEGGLTWLLASSATAAAVFMVMKRLKVF